MKSLFLANMTHEIRTPINAIVGFSEVLTSLTAADEKKEIIQIIKNNCDMLLRLINDILTASSLEAGRISIKPVDVDFAKTFNELYETLRSRVQEPGVEFLKDNPYDTLHICVDADRVSQVIINFVTNAVKYTHQGHIKVGYRTESRLVHSDATPHDNETARQPQQGLYVYCEDTGAGIPKDKQSSVFERFVKLNDYVQGTGLGLSICKAIANRSGGQIGVTSEGEGHGSTFWMWVPCELKQAL
jgi:signal transduction histidine kinase